MTASAPIVGTLRAIPDAASAPSPDSGVPAHANFRSVIEQYHSSSESASDTDNTDRTAPRKKQKDSDTTSSALPANPAGSSAGSPLVPQAVTPPVELPRLILPFTTSITLRQDTTTSPDDASTLDSTTATDPSPQSSGTISGAATTLRTPVIFRSTFDLGSLPLVSDSKSLPASAATQPKTLAKEQSKSSKVSASSKEDAAATPASPATADPSTPVLTVITSSTLQSATTAAQTTSTVNEVSELVPTPTPAPTFTLDRRSAYQFHSSTELPAETRIINRATQGSQKKSDPAPATNANVPIPVPVPVPNAVDPPPPVHVSTGAPAPRQTAPAAQNNSSAVTQDSSSTAATDSKTALSPVIERSEDTTAAAPQGSLAFAARLTPTEETSAPAPGANRTADSEPRPQTMLQTPGTARQIVSQADVQSDAHNGESGNPSSDQEKTSERFAKLETLLPPTHAPTADQPAAASSTHASPASPLTVAARMDQVQEAPPAPSSGNHDITIRIPDATTDQGTAVRFVERAGEVHVSVRTSDSEMAQTLRGGLNDLVTRLEDGGIRTQVWQPGADASTSQNSSQQPFADPDGSNGRQYSSGSNSEQESKQQNKPRWVEELEDSIGTQNSKETPQLWQA